MYETETWIDTQTGGLGDVCSIRSVQHVADSKSVDDINDTSVIMNRVNTLAL